MDKILQESQILEVHDEYRRSLIRQRRLLEVLHVQSDRGPFPSSHEIAVDVGPNSTPVHGRFVRSANHSERFLEFALKNLLLLPFKRPQAIASEALMQFMKAMEPKSTVTSLFLLFLLLAAPYFPRGVSVASDLNSEIYEIDYRGPETHSYIPPPHRSGGRPHLTAHPESKGLGAATNGENGKNIHG
ncbi:hypothetical protein L1049_009021 [Liquidambar formosana]|uniref:Uncharacterized protein n=1 Tax=Liquidambar formosana TaxID=63359 RepID=A0AAP0X8N6_LIQFO